MANRGVKIGCTSEVERVGFGFDPVELEDEAEDDAVDDRCLREEVGTPCSSVPFLLPPSSNEQQSRTYATKAFVSSILLLADFSV